MTRDEAIKELMFNGHVDGSDKFMEAFYMAVDALKNTKSGEWHHDGSHWVNRFLCSCCGYKLMEEPTKFCPDCGARMEVHHDSIIDK